MFSLGKVYEILFFDVATSAVISGVSWVEVSDARSPAVSLWKSLWRILSDTEQGASAILRSETFWNACISSVSGIAAGPPFLVQLLLYFFNWSVVRKKKKKKSFVNFDENARAPSYPTAERNFPQLPSPRKYYYAWCAFFFLILLPSSYRFVVVGINEKKDKHRIHVALFCSNITFIGICF